MCRAGWRMRLWPAARKQGLKAMSNTIAIGHLNKAAVLAALYNHSEVRGMGRLAARPGDMTVKEAEEYLKNAQYFDYLHGRVLKVDLSKTTLDP